MISKLSLKITELLLTHSAIEDKDKELYQYGFFMLISKISYFILALIIGLILTIPIESVIFYVAFSFIRQYAGGYHASTELRCNLMTSIAILCSTTLIYISKVYDISAILIALSLLCGILIFALCPLDTAEKPLTDKEICYFRKICYIILGILAVLIIVTFILKFNLIFIPCCVSLILESILLVAGKIKRNSQKKSLSQTEQ